MTKTYPLFEAYGWPIRAINKPVAGTIKVGKDSAEISAFSMDLSLGEITSDTAIDSIANLTAGFAFYVPVQLETDRIDLTLESAGMGRVGAVSLIEIRV